MHNTNYQCAASAIFSPKRLIHQTSEMAPKASESMQGPEQKSEAVQLNEVAAQSPSQIFNDTVSAGTAIKTQFVGSMTILAALANTDPLGSGGGTTTATATTTAVTAAVGNPPAVTPVAPANNQNQ